MTNDGHRTCPSLRLEHLAEAVGHACRIPEIGGKLYGMMGSVGACEIGFQVITRPYAEGLLLPMIENISAYTHGSGKESDKKPRHHDLHRAGRFAW